MGTKLNNRYKLLNIILVFMICSPAIAGEWEAHKQSLQNMVSSAADLEKEIAKLIKEKRHEKDRVELQKIMKDIETKHKKLEETYKKYNEEINHTKYRHPEQGDTAERTYTILKPRTIEQIENDIGLDGKLDRAKRDLEQHYNTPPPAPNAKKNTVRKEEKEQDLKPERIVIKK